MTFSSCFLWQPTHAALDVQHGAAHPVIGERRGNRRHVAIGAGDTGARMRALVPRLELGMLCLERGSAGVLVGPVAEADLVVVGGDLLDLEALRPGIDEALLRTLEVVLDVALAAHVGAHFGGRGLLVHVVVLHALRSLVGAHALDERRAGDSQCERRAIVAVDAGDRMAHELCRLRVGHCVDLLEALGDVAVARLLVRQGTSTRGSSRTRPAASRPPGAS